MGRKGLNRPWQVILPINREIGILWSMDPFHIHVQKLQLFFGIVGFEVVGWMNDGTPSEFNLGFTIVAYFVGPGTITFDPTFGSFTLLELVFVVKVFRVFRLKQIFLVLRVWT